MPYSQCSSESLYNILIDAMMNASVRPNSFILGIKSVSTSTGNSLMALVVKYIHDMSKSVFFFSPKVFTLCSNSSMSHLSPNISNTLSILSLSPVIPNLFNSVRIFHTLVAENPYPRGRGWIAALFCFLTVYIFDDCIL